MSTVLYSEPSIGLSVNFRSVLTSINSFGSLVSFSVFVYFLFNPPSGNFYTKGFVGGQVTSVVLFAFVYTSIGSFASFTLQFDLLAYYLTITIISLVTRITIIVIEAIKKQSPEPLTLVLLPSEICLILLTLPVIAAAERSTRDRSGSNSPGGRNIN